MTRRNLLDDIKQNPVRIYRAPSDVLRDRRFGDAERLEILQAWRDAGDERSIEIAQLIAEVQHRMPVPNSPACASAHGHAAE